MKNKIVLVTGANGGLGTHVTQTFLDTGATVIGTSRKITQSDFKSASFTAIPAELSGLDAAKTLLDKISTRFARLDVLVHTVGGYVGGATIAETDDTTWQSMLDVNLNSTFNILRAAIPVLRSAGGGRIVAIASRQAVDPGAGVGAYSASKAAMISLIKTVAIENHDAGVTANAILPGIIDTAANRAAIPKADFSKWVRPENIASLALWLASDAAKDITGAAIPMYGDV